MSSVSVVVVSYYTGSILVASLASVLQQQELANLIVVDNGNPPEVLTRLRQMSLMDPRIIVMTGHGNIGYAAGCNLGASRATGDYLLILNPDCLLPPSALARFKHSMEAFPATMIAGPLLLNPDGTEQRGGRRKLLTPSSAITEMLGLSRFHFNQKPLPDEPHDVPAVSGACMFLRREDYEQLRGMDERFFLHVEDLDLCMRVAKLGRRIICVPNIRVVHLLSTSKAGSSERIEWFKARSFVYYFEKHFGGALLPGLLHVLRAGIWLRYGVKRAALSKTRKNPEASRRVQILASSLTTPPSVPACVGKTLVVTGATSQIGLIVIRDLLASGAAVLAVSRNNPPPFEHPNLRWITHDLKDANISLAGYLADGAIHCAPIWLLPAIIPSLAEAEVKCVVAISSTSAYSKATSHDPQEADLAVALLRGEQAVMEGCTAHQIDWTVLRPTMVYGVGLDHNITRLARFIERFGWVPMYPHGSGRRQPVHAEDVAWAALAALTQPTAYGKAYNLSGGEMIRYREMLLRVFSVLNKPPVVFSTSLLPLGLRILSLVLRKRRLSPETAYRMNEDLVFFHDDAARDFGYRPRDFLSRGAVDLGKEE